MILLSLVIFNVLLSAFSTWLAYRRTRMTEDLWRAQQEERAKELVEQARHLTATQLQARDALRQRKW